MPMLCKVATGFSDVQCPTCGQGFLVYQTFPSLGREEQTRSLERALAAQHGALNSADVHAPAFGIADAPARAARRLVRPSPSRAVPAYS